MCVYVFCFVLLWFDFSCFSMGLTGFSPVYSEHITEHHGAHVIQQRFRALKSELTVISREVFLACC